MSPRVTVVIATYDYADVLPFSIASVLAQHFEDFELLVIGDACTDHSGDVVQAVADARVGWINLPENTGIQSGPHNEGLRRARGDVVAYLNHDDLWLPGHLGRLVAAIDSGADLAYATVLRVRPARRNDFRPVVPVGRVPRLFPSQVAHRRDAALAVGGWQMPEEIRTFPGRDLWFRMQRAGARFAFVPRWSVVKLPAGVRKDVYREQPTHEQAAWLERIRGEPDIELAELLDLENRFPGTSGRLWAAHRALADRPRVRARAAWGLAAARLGLRHLAKVVRRPVRSPKRSRPARRRRRSYADRYRQVLRFKGVDRED